MLFVAGSLAATVMVPAGVHEGEYITIKTDTNETHRIQVPQGLSFSATDGSFIPMELKPSYIVPSSFSDRSLQVHLHHTTNGVAISWATPTASNCSPTVVVGADHQLQVTGMTRTYPAATLEDGSAASFHHAHLDNLTDGKNYTYSLSCNETSFSASFVAPRQTAAKD